MRILPEPNVGQAPMNRLEVKFKSPVDQCALLTFLFWLKLAGVLETELFSGIMCMYFFFSCVNQWSDHSVYFCPAQHHNNSRLTGFALVRNKRQTPNNKKIKSERNISSMYRSLLHLFTHDHGRLKDADKTLVTGPILATVFIQGTRES